MPGTLFVVATPIGNLEDLSFRALRTLREVDLIAAEDTRRTAKLLAHYEIRRPMVSLREHNETRETPRLVQRLAAGERIALVSDAGTPGIADPGARLVRAIRDAGISVVPIPGPSAVTSALSVSGFPADRFTFLGFPPSSGAARQRWLNALSSVDETAVFFEAPHRINRTLADCRKQLVERQIIVIRESTKVNEELVIYQNDPVNERGEFCVVVEPRIRPSVKRPVSTADPAKLSAMFDCLTNELALAREEALTLAARAFGIETKAAAKAMKKYKYSVKR
jgi:16S rRNA (cytidine1402-2'-O)-methyltransferase